VKQTKKEKKKNHLKESGRKWKEKEKVTYRFFDGTCSNNNLLFLLALLSLLALVMCTVFLNVRLRVAKII